MQDPHYPWMKRCFELVTRRIAAFGPVPGVTHYNLVEILDYLLEHQPVFRAMNYAWISEHFRPEPVDVAVLASPEAHIPRGEGRLFMARYNGRLVGTCGLLSAGEARFEFTKMAVEKAGRGRGLGKALTLHALSVAHLLGARQVALYTQKILPQAIALYRSFGFREVSLSSYK